jgi:hypothetical protein
MPGLDFAYRLGWKAYITLVWEIVWDRFCFMWWRTETRSAEIVFGSVAALWAALLFHADTASAKHLSSYLETIAPAGVWQWLLFVLGGAQCAIAWFKQRSLIPLRLLIWMASFATWSYVMLISFLAVPPALITAAVAAVLVFGSFWAVTRTGRG